MTNLGCLLRPIQPNHSHQPPLTIIIVIIIIVIIISTIIIIILIRLLVLNPVPHTHYDLSKSENCYTKDLQCTLAAPPGEEVQVEPGGGRKCDLGVKRTQHAGATQALARAPITPSWALNVAMSFPILVVPSWALNVAVSASS
jgi:hypothetical protein